MKKKRNRGPIIETVSAVLWAGSLALVIRSFVFEPFHIPSDSMIPSLLVGDHLFVSKFSYGYSRQSFPFSPPVIKDRVLDRAPGRGDVVVFKKISPPAENYIKRLVGLPGDRIRMKRGRLYINGEAAPREFVGKYYILNLPDDARSQKSMQIMLPGGDRLELEGRTRVSINGAPLPPGSFSVYYKRARDLRPEPVERLRYVETLPNGVKHDILEISDSEGKDEPDRRFDDTPEYLVPEGHYFMMGDNRDISQDSRFSDVGFVAARDLIGRAKFIFYSHDGSAGFFEFWRWLFSVRYGRLLKGVE
ncbi:MAG: signal peptidase I [Rickettsiales bacterium]|jgi:signal peptidase I|nr:signal peptidase I [Rickettsiales bacterium]